MSTVAKAMIIGRVGGDVELRYFNDDTPVANLSVATDSRWTDRATGERRKKPVWHWIVVVGKQAEYASQYVKKGALVYVEGRIRTREWKDKKGNKHQSTEIAAERLTLLPSAKSSGTDETAPAEETAPASPESGQ